MHIFIPIPRRVVATSSGKIRATVVGYIDAILQSLGLLVLIASSLYLLSLGEKVHFREDQYTKKNTGLLAFVLALMFIIQIVMLIASVKLIQSTNEEISPYAALKKAQFWHRIQATCVLFLILHLIRGLVSNKNHFDQDHYLISIFGLIVRVVFYVLVSDHVQALHHKVLTSVEAPALVAVTIPYDNLKEEENMKE